jgi:hypothetical protein
MPRLFWATKHAESASPLALAACSVPGINTQPIRIPPPFLGSFLGGVFLPADLQRLPDPHNALGERWLVVELKRDKRDNQSAFPIRDAAIRFMSREQVRNNAPVPGHLGKCDGREMISHDSRPCVLTPTRLGSSDAVRRLDLGATLHHGPYVPPAVYGEGLRIDRYGAHIPGSFGKRTPAVIATVWSVYMPRRAAR